MFERNDKALLTTRIIIMVTIGILAVCSLAVGIILTVIINGLYFLVAVVGLFVCWLIWVFARLYMSYLCDVKLIRNKLYGENNDSLEVFLKAKEERSTNPEIITKREQTNEALKHLQQLLSSGIITAEEYETRKRELTEGK